MLQDGSQRPGGKVGRPFAAIYEHGGLDVLEEGAAYVRVGTAGKGTAGQDFNATDEALLGAQTLIVDLTCMSQHQS